jgi:hypothetical protein
MFYKIMTVLIITAAALLIVWLYNINKLVQYEICSNQSVSELSEQCKVILNIK